MAKTCGAPSRRPFLPCKAGHREKTASRWPLWYGPRPGATFFPPGGPLSGGPSPSFSSRGGLASPCGARQNKRRLRDALSQTAHLSRAVGEGTAWQGGLFSLSFQRAAWALPFLLPCRSSCRADTPEKEGRSAFPHRASPYGLDLPPPLWENPAPWEKELLFPHTFFRGTPCAIRFPESPPSTICRVSVAPRSLWRFRSCPAWAFRSAPCPPPCCPRIRWNSPTTRSAISPASWAASLTTGNASACASTASIRALWPLPNRWNP